MDQFKLVLIGWRGRLRQKEAAALLGIPVATYRSYEKGKRTPGKLARVELERRMIESNKSSP